MESSDSGFEKKGPSVACSVEGCHETFESKQGARIHFRYHTEEEKRAALLAGVSELSTELGRPPTAGEMDELGQFSVTTYQNYFSSWADALRATGFEPHRNRDLTKADLIQNIHDIQNEIGRVPTAQDIVKAGKHSIRTYIERFGSWNQALRESGYTPNAVQDVHEDDLLCEIKRLHEVIGHVPSAVDMDERGRFSSVTYWSKLGSWNQAVRLAGFEPQQTVRDSWDQYYGPDWASRREQIFQRDNHACRACGLTRSSATEDLHVHHIRPAREFVSDEEVNYEDMNASSNLIALCRSCHVKFEGLWGHASPEGFAKRARTRLD